MPHDADTAVEAAVRSATLVPRRRGLLIAAVVVLLLWMAALITLALTTGNPPQINPLQLSRARYIVTARVENVAEGRCRVVKQWRPGMLPEEIRVSNLSATNAVSEREYILPLINDPPEPGRFSIVTDTAVEMLPYIYPATADVERQLEAWMAPAQ